MPTDISDLDTDQSRRSILKRGALSLGALGVTTGGASAQNETAGTGTSGPAGGSENGQTGDTGKAGWMAIDEFRRGAIFRVESPRIDETPLLEGEDDPGFEAATQRVVQYFNTGEEAILYLPADAEVEQGTLYRLSEDFTLVEESPGPQFVRIGFQRFENQDLAVDLAEADVLLQSGSGGEGAVRPRHFSAGAIFRFTSTALGWVPTDVAQSGHFTEYNTHHAAYVGTDENFLFFPQEGAQVETGVLYAMHDEFELLDPEGNLVAVEFARVKEESLPSGDYIP